MISTTIRQSFAVQKSSKAVIHRSKSDVDEISNCVSQPLKDLYSPLKSARFSISLFLLPQSISIQLQLALNDAVFNHRTFHRFESGELKPRRFRTIESDDPIQEKTRSSRYLRSADAPVKACPPMEISDQTRSNLGKVRICSR